MTYVALPTKNPGDVLTSALWNTYLQGNADAGFMRMIADTTLGVAAASINFASIPQTFAHLLVVAYLRGDTAAAAVNCWLRLNGDAGADYDYQYVAAAAAAASGAEAFAQAQLVIFDAPAATAPANVFSAHEVKLPHYANAVNNKSCNALVAAKEGTTTGTLVVRTIAGFWRSNAAINQITILPAVGNFVAGSRATVYGLPQ